MTDNTSEVNKGRHIFSRRDFLGLAGLGAARLAFGRLNIIYNLEGGKNELYRPVVDQMRDAVEKSEQEGIKVTYSKNPEFQSIPELTPAAIRILQNEIIATIKYREIAGGRFKYNAIELVKNRLPDNVVVMLISAASNIENFKDLQVVEGSGFAKRQNAEQDIRDLDSFVKSQAGNNGPVRLSSSDIFYFWIKRDNGDLRAALWDTAISLKFFARNNIQTGEFTGNFLEESRSNVEFYNTYIKDEFSAVGSYSDLYSKYGYYPDDPNHSALNRIGLPYHAYSKIAMLDTFPFQFVASLTAGQMWAGFENQGEIKAYTNLIQVNELGNIEKYLNSLSK